MKKFTGITGIKSRINFPKGLLRKFVRSKAVTKKANKINESKIRFSSNYEPIQCTSLLLPVSGRLDILLDAKHPEALSRVSIPVQSAFLVTCTKEEPDNYKITWSCSLS